jgi:hypothetical protein
MMSKFVQKEPLQWDTDWFRSSSYDVCWDAGRQYQIRRIRDVAGVDVAAVNHLGRRVYVAQTLDMRHYEFVCLYCGFSEQRAKRHCELHRLRLVAAIEKRRQAAFKGMNRRTAAGARS